MGNKRIRVGIVGLNPGIHWPATAHMPALPALRWRGWLPTGSSKTMPAETTLTCLDARLVTHKYPTCGCRG